MVDSKERIIVVEVPEDSTAEVLVMTLTRAASDPTWDTATGSLYFNASTDDGTAVETDLAASWVTDGTDDLIQVPMTADLVENGPRDLWADFEIQGYNGGNKVVRRFILRVTPRARVAA